MKKFTLMVGAMLLGAVVFGQTINKRNTEINIPKSQITQERDITPFWEEDFATGDNWEAQYDDTNPNNGPWVIGTTPPAGFFSAGMGAIASTTAENGFAMFDSDAVGSQTTSQESYLVLLNPIDCSEQEKVSMKFESFYRRYHGNCFVEISNDNSTWHEFQIHDDIRS